MTAHVIAPGDSGVDARRPSPAITSAASTATTANTAMAPA